ncbi:TPA: hypothetical protein HA241_02215 [Candidatus Woesearchaeota archaeon]|uniref:Uncharacterized protein n=1 Tax=Candidatus Amesbacteria bacterium GW2011_GWA2_42_12 TaxID=1618356 RepID=A0A0G1A964_9BACT|nr:MAG: hypothetical protein UU93_C0034G0003 [Candidatus Amesbacteria bacterium GW2011_GWA2_42_12]HIH10977.1 hypothetical protein [Candidatus Woesearchaeota archaeon]
MKTSKTLVFLVITVIVFLCISITLYRHQLNVLRDASLQKSSYGITLGEGVYFVGDPIHIFDIPLEEFSSVSSGDVNDTIYTKNKVKKEVLYENHKIFSVQLSPLKNRIGLFYYPDDSQENLEAKIFNIDQGVYKEIYHSNFHPWNVGGNLQWLGNDHVFFTVHCGSSCQGLILLDVITGKTHSTTIASMSSVKEKSYTIFPDWFSKKEFRFDGLINEMNGEMKDGKAYLVFKMVRDDGAALEEKRFLFTGNSLKFIN